MEGNFLLPYYGYTLKTTLTPKQLQHKLASTLDVSGAHLLNPLFIKKGCKFSGYAEDADFKVTLIKFYYMYDRNDSSHKSYKVSSQKIVVDFYGKVSVESGVTTVKIKVRPSVITATIMGLGIFLPPLMALVSLGERNGISMGGALLFSLVCYIILMVGFSFNATDTQKMLDAIINGEDISE